MKKHYKWVGILGFVVFIMPFLSQGLPYAWEQIIQFIVGISLMFLAFIEKQMLVYTSYDEDEKSFEESEVKDDMFSSSEEMSVDNWNQ